MSNFDAYFVTRFRKGPKPFVFAVKSTDNLSFFENKADYVHVFSCGQKEGQQWIEKLLLTRVSLSICFSITTPSEVVWFQVLCIASRKKHTIYQRNWSNQNNWSNHNNFFSYKYPETTWSTTFTATRYCLYSFYYRSARCSRL
jgi:hypothetical protein